MGYDRIVISSGHGLYVRGAAGVIDEVDEARKVVEALAEALRERGVEVTTFHDDTSHSQNENLWTITDFHNSCERDLDISVHFNAFEQRSQPVGTEVWYVTQSDLAKHLSAAMASVGGVFAAEKAALGEELSGNSPLDLTIAHELEKPALVHRPVTPVLLVGVEHLLGWRESGHVCVVHATDLAQEILQIASLGEPRQLRHVVEPYVHNPAGTGRAELREERLG
jgi:N-acetylmuramoyl-L-alanine amidase